MFIHTLYFPQETVTPLLTCVHHDQIMVTSRLMYSYTTFSDTKDRRNKKLRPGHIQLCCRGIYRFHVHHCGVELKSDVEDATM